MMAIIVFMAMDGMAQNSSSPKPRWLNGMPTPTNNTFRYEMHSAISSSLEGARAQTLDQIVGTSGLKNGVVVVTESSSKRKLNQHWVNGKLTETYDVDSEHRADVKGSEQTLYIEKVAEYWEQRGGEYCYTAAYAKSELDRPPLFDNVSLTRHYGARGFWRSMLIPGWGQIYKGSTLKGCTILGATAICAVGIVVTDNQRADYVKKINHTHDASLIKSYRTKRDHWTTGRNICIGATAALYIYNLIDALVVPGAERIVVHNYGRGKQYSLLPTVDADGSVALSANLTF